MFATGSGEIAQDGTGSNSPFTTALSAAMLIPGLSLQEVFATVAKESFEKTQGQQRPALYDSSSIRFAFMPKE